jgi:alpha-L-fucosidase
MKQTAAAGAAMLLTPLAPGLSRLAGPRLPSYLAGHAEEFALDPHGAALSWFREAGSGLFLHYGLYSLLEQGEWVQLHRKIPVADYEKLKLKFTAAHFDAGFIAELAVAAGMKYVNLTAKHHEGFCLFKTSQTDYNSCSAAAGRDLVGELREACAKKGLGLFLYYSVAADWHHPYFLPRKAGWGSYRPAYDTPQPQYRYTEEADFSKYLSYVRAQLRELVTRYRPAGIWFDPIMGFYARPDLFPMSALYAEIRALCPYTLVSFKQGATGTEDFGAPERGAAGFAAGVSKTFGPAAGRVARKAWQGNAHKHNETCNTLQPRTWGYNKAMDGKHKQPPEVLALLKDAASRGMNLLLNTGPLPDGSIYPGDAATLRAVGKAAARNAVLSSRRAR